MVVRTVRFATLFLVSLACGTWLGGQPEIPLPEHPRPDFQRPDWANLNGRWQFRFDPADLGIEEAWYRKGAEFPGSIVVPFPWGSRLSGVEDEADIAWYSRNVEIPESWKGKRVFLVIGACDWRTTAWLDGSLLGTHQGGYTPFEFELTPHLGNTNSHRLVLRVDDTPFEFKLEGKQGYGRAAGIWQTPYLEARPEIAVEAVRFTPDIDKKQVLVRIDLDQQSRQDLALELHFRSGALENPVVRKTVAADTPRVEFSVPIENPRLWELEDPYLYEVEVRLKGPVDEDRVSTYFGMRKFSIVHLPGTEFPYIALNDRPVYLQMTLDQAYHPDGFYTFPSDAFMRDEILRTKTLGLNGQRIHIKVEIPRKLYWADRLGVLIMADVPNFWGPPTAQAQAEHEQALRGMIQRDYNHPAIFSWVIFNETWGLRTPVGDNPERREYLPETQRWVENRYHEVKALDPTRLVEDNSANRADHVVTDINSWHAYLPGYAWRDRLEEVSRNTYPGSPWNYVEGRRQGAQPMMNSECGNVWGYKGSTGDVDWSWDYHLMINEFRRHPKVCGWLYTEHHDVINEWNGYYQYDRSRKFTGLEELVPGMTLADWHSPFFVAADRQLCRQVLPGQTVSVPLFASFMTDRDVARPLHLKAELFGWDTLGNRKTFSRYSTSVPYEPWMSRELSPLEVQMPAEPALVVLALQLEDRSGTVLHRNFTTYLVASQLTPRDETMERDGRRHRVLRIRPDQFEEAQWSLKTWQVLRGLKVNGAGAGFFEYRLDWPANLDPDEIAGATFRVEASSKELFAKDREGAGQQQGDFMRGRGTHINSLNPNSYPMTDATEFPSLLKIRVNGNVVGEFSLEDDSADHRGILSWFSQEPRPPREAVLEEAGSFGQLVTAIIPVEILREASKRGSLLIRLEVDEALPGGLAIYGERFGRYPLDPTVALLLKD